MSWISTLSERNNLSRLQSKCQEGLIMDKIIYQERNQRNPLSKTIPNKTESRPDDTPVPGKRHKSLEERAAEYNGNLNLDGELNWRSNPGGRKIW